MHLDTRDDEELWRLMYRRSGMGRLEFKQALQLGRYIIFLLSCRHLFTLSGLGEVRPVPSCAQQWLKCCVHAESSQHC